MRQGLGLQTRCFLQDSWNHTEEWVYVDLVPAYDGLTFERLRKTLLRPIVTCNRLLRG